MSDVASLLCDLGLSGYQSRILLALADGGPGNSAEIAEWSGVPRTSVYARADELMERRLVKDVGVYPVARWEFVGWKVALAELIDAEAERHYAVGRVIDDLEAATS